MILISFILIIIWYLVCALAVIFIGLIITAVFTMRLGVFVKAHCNPKINGRRIAITFDDGPDLETTKVLDVLKNYGAKATFFCIGQKIEKYPEIFQRLINEGHLVGNHSYTHSQSFPFFRQKRILKEFEDTDAIIRKYQGHKPIIFRPPFGVTNPNIAAALSQSGHEVIGWNLRSFDTVHRDPKKLLAHLISKIKPGTVLLLHDNIAHTAEIVEGILQFAEKENYTCLKADEIFELET